MLAANNEWSGWAEDSEDGGLRLEGRFVKGSRRSQPLEEEEVRSLRLQRGAGRGGRSRQRRAAVAMAVGWMKMKRVAGALGDGEDEISPQEEANRENAI